MGEPTEGQPTEGRPLSRRTSNNSPHTPQRPRINRRLTNNNTPPTIHSLPGKSKDKKAKKKEAKKNSPKGPGKCSICKIIWKSRGDEAFVDSKGKKSDMDRLRLRRLLLLGL